MNKKFSTLMAMGLLATSSLCGSAWAQGLNFDGIELKQATLDATKPVAGNYFVVASDDATLSDDDLLLRVEVAADGTMTYMGVPVTDAATVTRENYDIYRWSIAETGVTGDDGTAKKYRYTLKNVKAGTYLTFKTADRSVVKAEADSKSAVVDTKKGTSPFFSVGNATAASSRFVQGNLLCSMVPGSEAGSALVLSNSDVLVNGDGNGISKLFLCQLGTKEMGLEEVEALNDVKGGAGFNLKFSAGNKDEWKNNLFDEQDLKAFYVGGFSSLNDDADYSVPAGVYFATDYPAALNNTSVISDVKDFMACTFVAVDPKGNYDIHEADRAAGIGFELKTVEAATMNFFNGTNASDDFSADGDVFVGNACFALEVPDAAGKPNEFNIKAKTIHYFVTSTDNAKLFHETKDGLYIGVINDQHVNYLVTTATGLTFEATNTTIMDGDDLVEAFLNTENAASIYTIQFVSGEDEEDVTEYKQYLTAGKDVNHTGDFAPYATVEYDAADPAYQFVVTAVDTDEDQPSITFTNRLTKYNFKVQLYKNGDGVYTVYPLATDVCGKQVRVEWYDGDDKNANVEFKPVDLLMSQIVFTELTDVDKYATFVNRADNLGLVQFELAKSTVAGTAFYIGGTYDDEGEFVTAPDANIVKAYVDAENMTQFELIKSEEPSAVVNKYIYLKDKRIMTGGNDSVAYYNYKVKVFDPEEKADGAGWYLDYANGDYKLVEKTNVAYAKAFILKQNVDGSIALIYASDNKMDAYGLGYAEVDDVKKDETEAWGKTDFYDLANRINEGLKTFMVPETPAVSYEAVPQHVSFEAVPGGFMTMDENNDARLAIATEASEELTFWLDTVKSDRQVPSFYITKGGNFLYNAIDSAKYYNDRNNYRYNLENKKYTNASAVVAKLIFKAAELVSSDTLKTVVDNKSVLVAEDDNAPKKILGGLADFQFQIVLAEDADDEYLIRQGNNYVGQYGNFFYLGASKETAYRFFIEKQSTPTANEDIEAAEVKVLAGNGQVTIAGAAGKKVVISNILGQVVANTVISSDNATIAAPAGVVVVAVEGEAAVKAIVK